MRGGIKMAKYKIYAVGYGVNPETKEPVSNLKFKTWDECKPYVVGVEGAKYKGFLTDTEADAWLKEIIESIENIQVNKNPSGFSSRTVDKNEAIKQVADVMQQLSGGLGIVKSPHDPMVSIIKERQELDQEFINECTNRGINPGKALDILKRNFISQLRDLDLSCDKDDTELPWR